MLSTNWSSYESVESEADLGRKEIKKFLLQTLTRNMKISVTFLNNSVLMSPFQFIRYNGNQLPLSKKKKGNFTLKSINCLSVDEPFFFM